MKNLNITPTTLNQDPSHQLRQIHQVTLSQPKTLKTNVIKIQIMQNKLPNEVVRGAAAPKGPMTHAAFI